MSSSQKQKLIFVIGLWRSGTSLLHTMLNQHPQIAVMYEAEPFGLFPLRRDYIFPNDWPERLEFYNQAISRHQLDAAKLPRNISGLEGLRAMFRLWADKKKATVIGGKSPVYHPWLPKISRAFPDAEFIIIWRNPLDCCRSAAHAGKQNRFFSSKAVLTQMLFGAAKMAKGILSLRASGRRVHELIFNDLIAQPEVELQKICDFIGLKFDSKMLDLESADYSMVPPGEHHGPVRSGVVQKNQSRTEILTPEFVAKGQRYMKLWQSQFSDLGFSRTFQKNESTGFPGSFEQLIDQLNYWHCRAKSHLKRKLFQRIPLSIWARLRGQTNVASQKQEI